MHAISRSKFITSAKVVTLGLLLGFGIQMLFAWTAPTEVPPNRNVDGPLTISTVAQYKQGFLGINSAIVPTNPLEVVGDGYITGKMYSASTLAGDPDNTLVTKDYVDGLGGGGSPCTYGHTIDPLNGSITCNVNETLYPINGQNCYAGHNQNCSVTFDLDDYGVVLPPSAQVKFYAWYFNSNSSHCSGDVSESGHPDPAYKYPSYFTSSTEAAPIKVGSFNSKGAGYQIAYDNNTHVATVTGVAYEWGSCGGGPCNGCVSDIRVKVKSY